MTKCTVRRIGVLVAGALLATSAPGASAFAQGYPPPAQGDQAPPAGQYAPPPPGYENGGAYEDQSQQYDREYADAYSQWAARYCVDQRNNNTAAGAIIGGVLGAAIGAGVAHSPATGAAIGGAIGAGTGAIAGASSTPYGCPPGYVVAAGAPAFAYSGYWGPNIAWAPGWYRPWGWNGRHWVYRPYRYWYWHHNRYWRPGWHARHWHYRYHRW